MRKNANNGSVTLTPKTTKAHMEDLELTTKNDKPTRATPLQSDKAGEGPTPSVKLKTLAAPNASKDDL